jgi:hypothetical protein
MPGSAASRPLDPVVEARIAHLERELRDLRARINTLFYSVLTVGLFELLGGLFLA